jgi:hypothetical protein
MVLMSSLGGAAAGRRMRRVLWPLAPHPGLTAGIGRAPKAAKSDLGGAFSEDHRVSLHSPRAALARAEKVRPQFLSLRQYINDINILG